MNNLLKFGLFLCIQLVASVSLRAAEGENCEECSKYFDDQVAENGPLRNQIIGIEPLKFQGLGCCSECVISGIHDFKRIEGEQICVTKSANGEIRRSIPVEFKNATAHCTCHMSSDHMERMKMMIKTLSNPIVSQCILGKIANGMDLFLPTINQDDVVRMQKCLPLLGKVMQQRENFKEFRLGGNWQNAKFRFDLVTKPGHNVPVIENTEVLQDDTTGMTPQCDGNDIIADLCKCAMEGNYMGHTFMQIKKITLPCFLEMSNQFEIPEVLTNMACPV